MFKKGFIVKYINLAQAIKILGLTKREIQHQRDLGNIPNVRLSQRKIVYPLEELVDKFKLNLNEINRILGVKNEIKM